MRGDQNIGRGPEGVVLGKRFRICHIKRGATDLIRLQCMNQCFLVDDLATSDVGDVRAARVALVQELKLVCGE